MSRIALYSCLVTAAAAACLSSLHAQSRPAAEDELIGLERFVTTGTNLPTAEDAHAVPVAIIGPQEIEQTGMNANLLEIVRKRMPAFAGNGNVGNTNSNTANGSTSGGSQASLRNLDTLVLIDGRRVSMNGANGRGGRSFVDLNSIPVSAIESIEVLTDGASAIYGSDAVGGVVNIKLKRNIEGGEVGARFGFAKSGYNERSAHATVGKKGENSSFTAAVSWSRTDPLFQKDRAFSAEIYGKATNVSGSVFPGTQTGILAPGIVSPRDRHPVGLAATATSFAQLVQSGTYLLTSGSEIGSNFNVAPYVTLLMEQEQKSIMLAGSVEIVPNRLEFFGDLLHTRADSMLQLTAQGVTGITVRAGSPYNPLTTDFTGAVIRYLPAPRVLENFSTTSRATAGFRGELGRGWQWEVAHVTSVSDIDLFVNNVYYVPNVNRAVAGGYNAEGVATPGGTYSRVRVGYDEDSTEWAIQPAIDVLARPEGIDPASLRNVLGRAEGELGAKLQAWDAKITGRPYALPAGDIGLAAGVAYMRESARADSDFNSRVSVRRWSGATNYDPFERTRSTRAAFAETRLPITSPAWNLPAAHALDLVAAYRVEDYSDTGKSEVPKFGLRWQPLDEQLTVRYTYSEAFTAPPLFSLYGPQNQGAVSSTVMRSVFGPGYDAAQFRAGSNPNLRPSTAETHSVGFVVSPKAVPGLTLSVDYVDADQKDLVSSIGTVTVLQSVEQLGPQSPYLAQVAFGDFPGEAGARPVTRAGELSEFLRGGGRGNEIYVFDGFVNVAGARVKALDVGAEYDLPTDHGRYHFSTTGTFFLDYRFQALPTEPYFEYAGHATAGGSGSEGTIPGYRFYTTGSWERGAWGLFLGHTYISSVTDIGPGGLTYVTSTSLQEKPIDSFQAWDLQVSYRFGPGGTGLRRALNGVRVIAGVNNVFDELAPSAPQAFVEAYADVSTYGAIGRLVFVSANWKF